MTDTKRVADTIRATLAKLVGNDPTLEESAFPNVFVGSVDLSNVLRKYDEESRYIVIAAGSAPMNDIRKKYFNINENAINLVFHALRGDVSYRSRDAVHLSLDDLDALQRMAEDSPDRRRLNFARFLVGVGPSDKHNPFQIQKAVGARMFFDRRKERQELLATERWKAMVGPRQIGKTSLAWAAHRDMLSDPSRYIDIDGAPVFPAAVIRCDDVDTETFWNVIYDRIGQSKKDQAEGRRHALTDPTKRKYRQLSAYESFKNLTTTIYRRPFVILDELDPLVVEDRGKDWGFFNLLRGWAEEANASLIMVGYMELDHALRESKFPFFKRCKLVRLSTMPKADAERLIELPITELGYEIEKQAIDIIYFASGGGPAQIQNISKILIDSLSANESITRSLAEEAIHASEVDSDYTSFINEASPMAKLAVSLIARDIARKNQQLAKIELTSGKYTEKLISLMEEVGRVLESEELDAIQLGNVVVERLDSLPVHTVRSLYRTALDELSLRYVLQQNVAYASYSYVSGYFFARVMLDQVTGQLDDFAEDVATEIADSGF